MERKKLEVTEKRTLALAAVALAVETHRMTVTAMLIKKGNKEEDLDEVLEDANSWWGRGKTEVGKDEKQERIECDECGEMVRLPHFREHQETSCSYRFVYCCNRHLGCNEELPLALLQLHLKEECIVERKKDEMAEKSKNRDLFLCAGCGQEVPLPRYRRHQREQCINRKMPCKNCDLGCRVMLRPSEREKHEFIDGNKDAQMRSCLYLGGQGAHMLLVRGGRGMYHLPTFCTIHSNVNISLTY
jgi:hypothetical protein